MSSAEEIWSGRRDSNPQPSAWEADALPLRHTRSLRNFRIANNHDVTRLLRARLLFHCLEACAVDNFAKLGFRHLRVVIFDYYLLQTYFDLLHTLRCFQ